MQRPGGGEEVEDEREVEQPEVDAAGHEEGDEQEGEGSERVDLGGGVLEHGDVRVVITLRYAALVNSL